MVSFEALNLTRQLSLQQIDANCRKSITVENRLILAKTEGKNQHSETLVMNVK